MDDQKQIEAFTRDRMAARVEKIMVQLIIEEVEKAIKENQDDFDLTTVKGIEEAVDCYLEMVTTEKFTAEIVKRELYKPLNAV